MIPELKDFCYERPKLKECSLTTLETRRLRGDQVEFKILNWYENIYRNMFFSLKKDSRNRGHEVKLIKDQCRLDIRKYAFSQRTNNRTRGHEVTLVKDQCRLDIRKYALSERTNK